VGEICGVLLAAGESRRMGFPKPLLKIGDETYLDHLTAAMLTAVDRLIVVIGAHVERVRAATPVDRRIAIVENREFARGQLSSLKVAITSASDAQAILVHLIDHPAVTGATFREVIEHYRRTQKAILIARYKGRRGHPVIFDHSILAELLAAPEDQGARSVVNARPDRVGYCDVADAGVVLDLDTPEDVARAGLAVPAKI
jgi:molybdenum cofactor cytidylyltransferase